MADEENKEIEYLLQVSVDATDLKEACNKITGGKIVAGGPMPKTQVPPQPQKVTGRPALLPAQNPLQKPKEEKKGETSI